MEIPEQVLRLASKDIRMEPHIGGELTYFGRYEGKDVYSFSYKEDVTIGLPTAYLWDGKEATSVSDGMEALNIICSAS